MPMTERDFEQVASAIRYMRSKVQTDLDRSYSVHGALILDRLTEQLADDFAARYPGFNQAAFLNDTQFRQGFDLPDDDVSVGPCIGSHLVYTSDATGAVACPSMTHVRSSASRRPSPR